MRRGTTAKTLFENTQSSETGITHNSGSYLRDLRPRVLRHPWTSDLRPRVLRHPWTSGLRPRVLRHPWTSDLRPRVLWHPWTSDLRPWTSTDRVLTTNPRFINRRCEKYDNLDERKFNGSATCQVQNGHRHE